MSLSHLFKPFRSNNFLGLGVSSFLVLASTSMVMAGAGITTGADKLYEGPVSGAAVIATIPAGSKVGILWCGMQQKWCLVNFHAAQGFVSFSSLELVGGTRAGVDAASTRAGGSAAGTSSSSASSPGPVATSGSTLPPMSVTGPSMAYVGGNKGVADVIHASLMPWE